MVRKLAGKMILTTKLCHLWTSIIKNCPYLDILSIRETEFSGIFGLLRVLKREMIDSGQDGWIRTYN